METRERQTRKVRFTLPDCSTLGYNSKYRTLHGTQQYINGTLISPPRNQQMGCDKKSLLPNSEAILKPSLVKDSQTRIVLNSSTTCKIPTNTTENRSMLQFVPSKAKCPSVIERMTNLKKPARQQKKSKGEAKNPPKSLTKISKKCVSLEDINKRTNSTNNNDYSRQLPNTNANNNRYSSSSAIKAKVNQLPQDTVEDYSIRETNPSPRLELKKPIIPKTMIPSIEKLNSTCDPADDSYSLLPKQFIRGRVRSNSCHVISMASKFMKSDAIRELVTQSDSLNYRHNDNDIRLINSRRPSVEMLKMNDNLRKTHLSEITMDNTNLQVKKTLKLNLLTVPNLEDKYDDDINAFIDKDSWVESSESPRAHDQNTREFWNFVEKWRSQHMVKPTAANVSLTRSLANSTSIKTDGNCSAKSSARLQNRKSFRMNSEPVPLVTTLLRGSRDSNEILLKEVFRKILDSGISKENLNAVDKSGRTAFSYICSTTMTKFLELFLQLPGIDVNRADNEGNTPLHFAAQAGHAEIINTLLTKSRSIIVDAKNNLGFTPLMKAALQGRTRCAKLLLFAGASPVETDSGRGLRAEQWARFCARHSCAEMIEQCARARLLDKTTSNGKWSHDSILSDKMVTLNNHTSSNNSSVQRIKTQQQSTQTGFRSKFRKVFPFGFSLKDKNTAKQEDETYSNDLVNYLTAATLCVSGPALPAQANSNQLIKSLIRPLEVPKLEVTYANNNSLIKKYESSSQPAIPPRGKVKK